MDNADPLNKGRIRVKVPAVSGHEVTGWALPCAPPGDTRHLPALNSMVFVMFEQGDPDFPVWMGSVAW